jgi:hypothetical protein
MHLSIFGDVSVPSSPEDGVSAQRPSENDRPDLFFMSIGINATSYLHRGPSVCKRNTYGQRTGRCDAVTLISQGFCAMIPWTARKTQNAGKGSTRAQQSEYSARATKCRSSSCVARGVSRSRSIVRNVSGYHAVLLSLHLSDAKICKRLIMAFLASPALIDNPSRSTWPSRVPVTLGGNRVIRVEETQECIPCACRGCTQGL